MKKILKIEVDCANCASKVERAINKIDGVISCNINFMSQKMLLEADEENFDDVLKLALKAGKKVEPDFEIL